jgi:hypothetical protein
MAEHLRDHFERAVGDDPGVPAAEVARAAMAEGGRLRRRRRLVTAGVAAGLVAVAGGVVGLHQSSDPAPPPMTIAAAMMPATAPSCSPEPVERDATDAVVFLDNDATGSQAAAVGTALQADPRVKAMIHESREEAYERFRMLWADSPDFVAAVTPQQLPEGFRLKLNAPSQYQALRAQYAAMGGVAQIIGRRCSGDAPVGGVL